MSDTPVVLADALVPMRAGLNPSTRARISTAGRGFRLPTRHGPLFLARSNPSTGNPSPSIHHGCPSTWRCGVIEPGPDNSRNIVSITRSKLSLVIRIVAIAIYCWIDVRVAATERFGAILE